ncbi:anthranilate synthase component II [Corynebacterium nasicanis]|uniref:anthranilate synthase n=1 Tax=Corynebacterium nasicanis TaxID=1448267 RepID=A0ABW1QDP1_9CORY
MTHIVLVDNHDSFVYNLVDAFAGYRCTVFRNTVSVDEILAAEPDLICLSPGPGYPADAGNMMELIDRVLGTIPLLGICLGFQALIEHHGGTVEPCGPVHGVSVPMTLSDAGLASPVFAGLSGHPGEVGRLVPVARYHSLGCVEAPAGVTTLATTDTAIGEVIMAASMTQALGLQFHPESVLSPSGPIILHRCVEQLLTERTPR